MFFEHSIFSDNMIFVENVQQETRQLKEFQRGNQLNTCEECIEALFNIIELRKLESEEKIEEFTDKRIKYFNKYIHLNSKIHHIAFVEHFEEINTMDSGNIKENLINLFRMSFESNLIEYILKVSQKKFKYKEEQNKIEKHMLEIQKLDIDNLKKLNADDIVLRFHFWKEASIIKEYYKEEQEKKSKTNK